MIIYVAHRFQNSSINFERAKQITHNLQIADKDNVYICPLLVFSHSKYNEIPHAEQMELCLDILSVCDKMIVASDISKGVSKEIDYANLVGMEVEWLEDA
jgi:hypothetical protein